MAAPQWIGSWQGGRIKQGLRGPVYVLEQKRDGVRYSIVLDVDNEDDARLELRLFDRDPTKYQAQIQKKAPLSNGDLATAYDQYL